MNTLATRSSRQLEQHPSLGARHRVPRVCLSGRRRHARGPHRGRRADRAHAGRVRGRGLSPRARSGGGRDPDGRLARRAAREPCPRLRQRRVRGDGRRLRDRDAHRLDDAVTTPPHRVVRPRAHGGRASGGGGRTAAHRAGDARRRRPLPRVDRGAGRSRHPRDRHRSCRSPPIAREHLPGQPVEPRRDPPAPRRGPQRRDRTQLHARARVGRPAHARSRRDRRRPRCRGAGRRRPRRRSRRASGSRRTASCRRRSRTRCATRMRTAPSCGSTTAPVSC